VTQGTVEHLYVHLPFCRSRCAYCDFASEPLGPHFRAGRVERYLGALLAEWRSSRHLLAERLTTVYIGGGSPTALPEASLIDLVAFFARHLRPGGELTVEADPGGLDERRLEAILAAGANRLSLGVQSFSPALRRSLGRRVQQDEVERAVGLLTGRLSGDADATWGLDLVFAIPGQDRHLLLEDLARAIAARPAHVSLYDLTYTASYDRFLASRVGANARERAEEFGEEAYSEAVDLLDAAGYRRYEVSNFAPTGRESRHNLGYWRGEDYLGLGAAAVSTVGLERRTNPTSVADYLAGVRHQSECLTTETRMFERVMLGLRTSEGVPYREAAPVLDGAAWERAVARGLGVSACDRLFLTRRGLDVSNSLLAEVLILPESRPFLAEV
jgi:oxygen-independent coproporphyrinogen III oxidase